MTIQLKSYADIWYLNNRESHIANVRARQIETNYASEKTNKQRFIRNIKRKTRYHFRLKDKRCEFCDNKATEHHHNTIPIEFDKFNFVCHNCHINKCKEG